MKRHATDAVIDAFIEAVFPDAPALARVSFDEAHVLRTATEAIAALRHQLAEKDAAIAKLQHENADLLRWLRAATELLESCQHQRQLDMALVADKQQEVDQLTQELADRTEDLKAGFDNADGLNALIQAERAERRQEVRQAFEAGMAARKPDWAAEWSFTPAEGMGPTYRRAFAAYQQQHHPTKEK